MGEKRENKECSASVCAPSHHHQRTNNTDTQPPPRQDEVDEIVKKYFFTRATPPGQDEVDGIVQKYFFSGDEGSVKSAPATSPSQRDVDSVVQKYLFSSGTGTSSSASSVDGAGRKDHRRFAGTADYFGSTPESRPLADGGGGVVAHQDWSSMSRGKLRRMGGGPGAVGLTPSPNRKQSPSSSGAGGVVVDLNRHTIPETECVAPQVEYVRVVPATAAAGNDADDEARDQPCSHGPHHYLSSSQTFEIGEVGDDVSIDESCTFSISFSVSQQQQQNDNNNQHRRKRGSVDLCTVGDDEEEEDDEIEEGGCSLEEAEEGGETTTNGEGRGCGAGAGAGPAGGGDRRLGLRDQIHRFSSGMMSSYTSLGRQRTGCCAPEGDFEPDGDGGDDQNQQPQRTKFDHSFFLEARFVPRSCVLLVIGVALIVAAAALTMHHASSPPPTPSSLGVESTSDGADDAIIAPPSSTTKNDEQNPPYHHHVGASVMELLSQITPVDTLQDPDAPQRHAMRWIIEEENALDLDGYVDDLDNQGPDTIDRLAAAEQSILEHYAVATLFYSTTDRTGMGWFVDDNWLSEVSVCDWYGVTCDGEGKLTQLQLPGNGLRGHIPEEIGALRSVELIDLSKNEITGSVPDGMGQLNHLTELHLQANHLEGAVPQPLCDGDLTPRLSRFSADCLGDDRRVDCPCCTECFFFGT